MLKPRIGAILLLGLLTGPVSACWVHKDTGRKMQAELAALQVEFEVVKKAHSDEKNRLQSHLDEAARKIVELRKFIEQYRKATGRNAADIGVAMDRMRAQLKAIKGRLEVLEHRLGQVEKGVQSVSTDVDQFKTEVQEQGADAEKARAEAEKNRDPLEAIERPASREDFYKLAQALLESKQYRASRTLFAEFLEKWPKGAYSDNALYWMGESYYAEKDFRQAALTFQRVREQYPKGDKSADALLKLGYCFMEMGKPKNALPFLREFVQRYPKSPMVKAARKKIQQAEKAARKKKGRR